MSLRLRPISRREHVAFVAAQPSVSFLQCPSWGDVKSEWAQESLGWVDDKGQIVGSALVLYRKAPKLRRYLAYIPEGPTIDWAARDLGEWLGPLTEHLKRRGAFGIKIGPPVTGRRWQASTIKGAIAARSAARLPSVSPDSTDPLAERVSDELRALGWRPPAEKSGFSAGQPRYVFQVPLAGRGLDEIFAGFNQLWRRNIRKAEKSKVEVVQGGADDLPAFHELYLTTAARDHFTGRPLSYFTRMYEALNAEESDRLRLYLARQKGETLAATIWVRVGNHAWYSYGASATHKREVRPSNAIQWQMLKDAYAAGANLYDLRGISDTLDESDHLFGLIQFKVGTGGEAVEFLGEWDLPLNRLLYQAFQTYVSATPRARSVLSRGSGREA